MKPGRNVGRTQEHREAKCRPSPRYRNRERLKNVWNGLKMILRSGAIEYNQLSIIRGSGWASRKIESADTPVFVIETAKSRPKGRFVAKHKRT